MSLHSYWHIMGRRLTHQFHLALDDLTPEQWHAVPEGRGNSMACIAWPSLRTEDNIINWIIGERRATVWMEGNWSERLGYRASPKAPACPPRRRTPCASPLVMDSWSTRDRSAPALTSSFDGWDPADYHTVITLKPLGQMTTLQALGQQGFPHGFAYLGESQHMRALLGLPGIGL